MMRRGHCDEVCQVMRRWCHVMRRGRCDEVCHVMRVSCDEERVPCDEGGVM